MECLLSELTLVGFRVVGASLVGGAGVHVGTRVDAAAAVVDIAGTGVTNMLLLLLGLGSWGTLGGLRTRDPLGS